jgi:hypothetical protein
MFAEEKLADFEGASEAPVWDSHWSSEAPEVVRQQKSA